MLHELSFMSWEQAAKPPEVFYVDDVVAVRFSADELELEVEVDTPEERYWWGFGKVVRIGDGGDTLRIKLFGDDTYTFSNTRKNADYPRTGYVIRTVSKNKAKKYGIAPEDYVTSEDVDNIATDKQLKRELQVGTTGADAWMKEMKKSYQQIDPKAVPRDVYAESDVLGQTIEIQRGKNRGWSGFFVGFSMGKDDAASGCGDYDKIPVYWFYLDPKQQGLVDENGNTKYCTFLQQPVQYNTADLALNQLRTWLKRLGTGEKQALYRDFVKARKRLKEMD